MKKGFTLIEVIIAIALIGILSLILTSIISYSMNNLMMSREQRNEQFDVRLTADLISREVRNAISIELSDAVGASGQLYIYCDGNDLIIVDETGSSRNYTDGKIQSASFSLVERTADKIFLEFFVVGEGGYSLDSSVLLNNILSEDITPGTNTVVGYMKP